MLFICVAGYNLLAILLFMFTSYFLIWLIVILLVVLIDIYFCLVICC